MLPWAEEAINSNRDFIFWWTVFKTYMYWGYTIQLYRSQRLLQENIREKLRCMAVKLENSLLTFDRGNSKWTTARSWNQTLVKGMRETCPTNGSPLPHFPRSLPSQNLVDNFKWFHIVVDTSRLYSGKGKLTFQ